MSGFQKVTMALDMVDGAHYDVRIMPGDIVRTERQFDISATQIDADPKLEHMLYMAWLAAKRHGYPGDFDAFCDGVENVDVQQGAAVPSPPAP